MAGQVGFKTESTVGTAATPDKFMPVTLARSGSFVPERLHRQGISARRLRKPPKKGRIVIEPHVELKVSNKNGIATLFTHMHGAVATQADTPSAGKHTHTYTFGSHLGDSFTLQVGVTDATDTVQPFTVAGTKVDSWELGCAVGEYLKATLDCVGMTGTTGTALASASYSDDEAFTFVEGTVSLAGSQVASARSFRLRCQKNLRKDRFRLGSQSTAEPLEDGFFDITGTIEADFEALTQHTAMVSGTQLAIVLSFTSGGAGGETLTVTMSGQLAGDPPELSSPGLASQTINFDVSHGTSDASAYTAVLVNSEASAA